MSKKGSWVTIQVDWTDKGTKRIRDHAFTARVLSWPYCLHCGLVRLKNAATAQEARKKCVVYE